MVCHIIRALGYPVYDCDCEARSLIDSDAAMRRRIADEITPDALNADGTLNRAAVAATVFSDSDKLNRLNAIVHGGVRTHFLNWSNSRKDRLLFVETAILYSSGFDGLVTEVWEVEAPRRLRIDRVMTRSGLDRKEIEQRMDAQKSESRNCHRIIINDGERPLIHQIMLLLDNEGQRI